MWEEIIVPTKIKSEMGLSMSRIHDTASRLRGDPGPEPGSKLLLTPSPPKKKSHCVILAFKALTSGPLHGGSGFVFGQHSKEFDRGWIAFPEIRHRREGIRTASTCQTIFLSCKHASPKTEAASSFTCFGLSEKNEYRESKSKGKLVASVMYIHPPLRLFFTYCKKIYISCAIL